MGGAEVYGLSWLAVGSASAAGKHSQPHVRCHQEDRLQLLSLASPLSPACCQAASDARLQLRGPYKNLSRHYFSVDIALYWPAVKLFFNALYQWQVADRFRSSNRSSVAICTLLLPFSEQCVICEGTSVTMTGFGIIVLLESAGSSAGWPPAQGRHA